jgi:hypothetical protein
MTRAVEYNTSDCLAALERAAVVHSPAVSQTQYDELGLSPSLSTLQEKLGGWNDGKKAAGLVENTTTNQWSDEALDDALVMARETLGFSFSRREFDELDFGPSSRTIARRHPEGWLGALDDHGVDGDVASAQTFTDAEALTAVVELTLENDGEAPGVVSFRESGASPSYNTVTKKLGVGWSEVKQVAEVSASVYDESFTHVPLTLYCELLYTGLVGAILPTNEN